MEAILILVAFGLIFGGVFGLLAQLRGEVKDRTHQLAAGAWLPPERPIARPALSQPAQSPGMGGLFSEVDMLRAQVEHLRSEIVALSSEPPRQERSQSRRYQTGPYAYLPRDLRREVHRVRSIRHVMHT
jgi:hypothetical protein